MENKFAKQKWEARQPYSDGFAVVDEDGFEPVELTNTAILLNYEEKLSIDHWADSEDASKDFSLKDQEQIANLVAQAPSMAQLLEKLQGDFTQDDHQWQGIQKVLNSIDGIKTE